MIQHIVLFNPKTGVPDESVRSFAQMVLDVLGKSPEVVRFTVGRRVDVDAGYERSFGDKTYRYAAVIDFDDQAGLVRYLTSPNHQKLGRMFWANCQDTVVVEVEVASGPGALDALL